MDLNAGLTIHLAGGGPTSGDHLPFAPPSSQTYTATCLHIPSLKGNHKNAVAAVAELLELIAREQTAEQVTLLNPEDYDAPRHLYEASEPDCNGAHDCVEHTEHPAHASYIDAPAHIAEWNELVRASHGEWDYDINFYTDDEEFEHCPQRGALWGKTGIPTEIARKFRALHLEPADAKRLHNAGRTPEETLPYVVEAESTGWWNWPDFNIVEWVIIGIPVERVRIYESRCTALEAAVWEGVTALYPIPTADLAAVLRAGFSPASVAANAAAWAEEGHSVGAAARTYISAAGLDRGPIRIVSGRP